MAKTEHRIAYKAGITRTPSDFLCEDGELAECINLTTDNEELKVVPLPEEFMRDAPRIVYVHRVGFSEHYIGVVDYPAQSGMHDIVWGVRGSGGAFQYGGGLALVRDGHPQVVSVGKTLVIKVSDDISYYLWKGDGEGYADLGRIPEPRVDFQLGGRLSVYGGTRGGGSFGGDRITISSNRGKVADGLFVTSEGSHGYTIGVHEGEEESYNDLAIGLYEKNLRDIAGARGFAKPFLIRYALKLFDGSYIMHSAPLMMFPVISGGSLATYGTGWMDLSSYYQHLFFKADFDYSAWSDIVEGVVVFVTPGVNVYDLSGDQNPTRGNGTFEYGRTLYAASADGGGRYLELRESSSNTDSIYFLPLNARNDSDIVDDLLTSSVFYKLFTIGRKCSGEWLSASGYIKDKTLETLATQEQLPDDYYSHCPLSAGNMSVYNYRLLLSDVRRGFYTGFRSFLPYSNSESYDYDVFVKIRTVHGTRIVRDSFSTAEKMGLWYYYPDPRAYEAVLFVGGSWYKTLVLDEHPYLNGSCYFKGLPDGSEGEPEAAGDAGVPTLEALEALLDATPEAMQNQLWASEVNNPFVFRAEGNVTVGSGAILGISSTTHALSQGQFGEYPLLVFSTEGIWACSVGPTGLFSAVHPMSREVCINASSITQTDGAVYFVSKKGLMVVAGGEVRCVSERMRGVATDAAAVVGISPASPEPVPSGLPSLWSDLVTACSDGRSFLEYVRETGFLMAYDYTESVLLLLHAGYGYAYVYSMADGAVSKLVLPFRVTGTVNAYPDCLLQDSAGKVYSLYGKKDETELSERQQAFLLTRPMKLSGPVRVSSLRELVNVGCWNKAAGSSVKTEVFVSDDLVKWHEMGSVFGAAARYFRIALYLDLLPTERLSGTIIREQERRGENARA